MSNETNSLFQSLLEGGIVADHHPRDTHPIRVAPTTASHFNSIKASIEPVACFKLEDARFEFDSSFILPEVEAELKELSRLHQKHKDSLLSIFGHADPVGQDDYNKRLSGQRALAMYGLLTRDIEIWERLNIENNWGVKANQIMLTAVGHNAGIADAKMGEQTREAIKAFQGSKGLSVDGIVGPKTRKELFKTYMDAIAKDDNGQSFKLEKTDFLAQGKGKDLKGDVQGCSEFNPLLLLSKAQKIELDKKENKAERDSKNQTNRRVMILLFKPGSKIEPAKWPCPTVKEGIAGCKTRFFSNGEKRRQNSTEEREFNKTKDTFACRFYQRLTETSPCEQIQNRGRGLFLMQCLSGDGTSLLAKRKYQIRHKGNPTIQFSGALDDTASLRHVRVPSGDYLLSVEGCGTDANIAVLRADETVSQVCFLENGRLAIHVLSPEGDPIPNATVDVDQLGTRLTDDEGVAFFAAADAGEFSFRVSKESHQPIGNDKIVRQSFNNQTEIEPIKEGQDSIVIGKVTVKNSRVNVTVNLKAKTVPVIESIIRIEARQAGTTSRRDPSKTTGLNTLSSSTSQVSDLTQNKPVVLLKGSRPVFLNAVTDPPSSRVDWTVTANENSNPLLTIDPPITLGDPPKLAEGQDPNRTALSTDQTGSYSVTAKVGKTTIVWNVIIVSLEVDLNSPVELRDSGLVDFGEFFKTPEGKTLVGEDKNATFDPTTLTAVASGSFKFGKHAWSSTVSVKLRGGGTSGTLGTEEIVVRVLQNVHADRVAGDYETEIALLDAINFPQLDTSKGSPDGYDGPNVGVGIRASDRRPVPHTPFLWAPKMFEEIKSSATERVFRVGDSPATGFPTKSPKNEKLTRIRGEIQFRDAVVAFSKHSKNALVVYADLFWQIDYSGDVEVSSAIGKWVKTTANVKLIQKWKPVLSSSGINGTDAGNALFEIFPPHAIDDNNKPKKFIKKL